MRKFLLPIIGLSLLSSCGANNASFSSGDLYPAIASGQDQDIREVYEKYVQNAKNKGETPLTYEEWLASIKGKDGKSAYELYKELHPDYQGDLAQWMDDLVNGRLGGSSVAPVETKLNYDSPSRVDKATFDAAYDFFFSSNCRFECDKETNRKLGKGDEYSEYSGFIDFNNNICYGVNKSTWSSYSGYAYYGKHGVITKTMSGYADSYSYANKEGYSLADSFRHKAFLARHKYAQSFAIEIPSNYEEFTIFDEANNFFFTSSREFGVQISEGHIVRMYSGKFSSAFKLTNVGISVLVVPQEAKDLDAIYGAVGDAFDPVASAN